MDFELNLEAEEGPGASRDRLVTRLRFRLQEGHRGHEPRPTTRLRAMATVQCREPGGGGRAPRLLRALVARC